ncbi:MAG: hypothetical protein AAFP90_08800, partial [Planctomycetota bacterium]
MRIADSNSSGGDASDSSFGNGLRSLPMILWLAAGMTMLSWNSASADNVAPLLGPFDPPRIESASQWLESPKDEQWISEVARLMYRVKRLPDRILTKEIENGIRGADLEPRLVGDAVRVEGQTTQVTMFRVPQQLVDVLEFDRLYFVKIGDADGAQQGIICSDLPQIWKSTSKDKSRRFRCQANGVCMRSDAAGRPMLVIAARCRWLPNAESMTRLPAGQSLPDIADGWQWLGAANFDVGLLDTAVRLDRRTLTTDDNPAFFGMLAATGRIDDAATAGIAETADLLGRRLVRPGQLLRVQLNARRIVRVDVSDPAQRRILGQNHYWEIDAFGKLNPGEKVVVERRGDADGNKDPNQQPLVMSGEYPVSLVTLRLPQWISNAVTESGGSSTDVMTMLRRKVDVDAFYYRLASYESEFMRRKGVDKQTGPILMAMRIRAVAPRGKDEIGARAIGWIALAVFGGGVVLVWLWALWNRWSDAAFRNTKKQG